MRVVFASVVSTVYFYIDRYLFVSLAGLSFHSVFEPSCTFVVRRGCAFVAIILLCLKGSFVLQVNKFEREFCSPINTRL